MHALPDLHRGKNHLLRSLQLVGHEVRRVLRLRNFQLLWLLLHVACDNLDKDDQLAAHPGAYGYNVHPTERVLLHCLFRSNCPRRTRTSVPVTPDLCKMRRESARVH